MLRRTTAARNAFPQILTPTSNQTFNLSSTAVLTCHVHDLGDHHVTWFKIDPSTSVSEPLAVGEQLFTTDKRYSVSSYSTSALDSVWSLEIYQLSLADEGTFLCKIANRTREREHRHSPSRPITHESLAELSLRRARHARANELHHHDQSRNLVPSTDPLAFRLQPDEPNQARRCTHSQTADEQQSHLVLNYSSRSNRSLGHMDVRLQASTAFSAIDR